MKWNNFIAKKEHKTFAFAKGNKDTVISKSLTAKEKEICNIEFYGSEY